MLTLRILADRVPADLALLVGKIELSGIEVRLVTGRRAYTETRAEADETFYFPDSGLIEW